MKRLNAHDYHPLLTNFLMSHVVFAHSTECQQVISGLKILGRSYSRFLASLLSLSMFNPLVNELLQITEKIYFFFFFVDLYYLN